MISRYEKQALTIENKNLISCIENQSKCYFVLQCKDISILIKLILKLL